MNEYRKQNNSQWIVDEYTEWIDKAVQDVEKLYNDCNSSDKDRLYIKLNTLKMAKNHFDDLKFD